MPRRQILPFILLAMLTILTAGIQATHACVGRMLYIGALNSTEEKVLAEMLVLLITERTGTTVKIRFFDNADQIYGALKSANEEERVDISVEDTADAIKILKKSTGGSPDKDYQMAKDLYEKELDLVWLNPFGFNNFKGDAEPTVAAPVIRKDVLTNFPLLPRVLNKLAGAIENSAYSALLASANSGKKPKNVAQDYLREKKFI